MITGKSVFKEAAEIGAQKLLEYFNTARDARDSEAAQYGLKAGSNFARLYSAETNRLATEVKVAKESGATQEHLARIVADLTGREILTALPSKPERSNAAPKSGKRSRLKNQPVA